MQDCWSRAYRIHAEPNKQTPIEYGKESDTSVIGYPVNSAKALQNLSHVPCMLDDRQQFKV